MLKLDHVVAQRTVTTTIDEYVPLRLEFHSASTSAD